MVEISEEEYKEFLAMKKEKEHKLTSEELGSLLLKTRLDEAGNQIPELYKSEQIRFDKAESAILSQNTELQKSRLRISYNVGSEEIEFDSC